MQILEFIKVVQENLISQLELLKSIIEVNAEISVVVVFTIIVFITILGFKELYDIATGSNKKSLKEKNADLENTIIQQYRTIDLLKAEKAGLLDHNIALDESLYNIGAIKFKEIFTPDILRAIVEMQEKNKNSAKFIVESNIGLSKSPELSDSAIEELTKNISSAEKDLKVVDDFIGKKPTGGFHESNDI